MGTLTLERTFPDLTHLSIDATRLKRLRERKNVSQAVVAAAVGITPQSLSDMELGKCNPAPNTLLRLCVYFKCPLTDLSPQIKKNLPRA